MANLLLYKFLCLGRPADSFLREQPGTPVPPYCLRQQGPTPGTFAGETICRPVSRNCCLTGRWAGSFSEDRPLGWDPVAEGNRAGDGMACNSNDRRQWRKQEVAVGTAASRMRVLLNARSICWVPQPVLVSEEKAPGQQTGSRHSEKTEHSGCRHLRKIRFSCCKITTIYCR